MGCLKKKFGSSKAPLMLRWAEGIGTISRRGSQPERQGQGLGAPAWAPPMGGMTQAARGNTGSGNAAGSGVYSPWEAAHTIAKGSSVEREQIKEGEGRGKKA